MILIGFNYSETPGKQISLFKRRRQENDGCKEKIVWFTCLNSEVKKKKHTQQLGFFGSFTGEHRKRKNFLAQQMGLFVLTRPLPKKL